MKLLKQQPGAFREDIQIESSVAKLGFNITSAAGGFTDAGFNACLISVNINSKNKGSEVLLPKMKLRDALSMAAYAEGLFVWSATNISGAIDLGFGGALAVADGSYISVSYEGLPADALTDLFAVDNHVLTSIFKKIERVTLAGTAKDFNIASRSDLYIPLTDGAGNGIDTIKLEYPSKTVTYTEDELKIINEAVNDLVYVKNLTDKDVAGNGTTVAQYGYDNLLWLDITDAVRMTITPKTDVNIGIYLTQIQSIL